MSDRVIKRAKVLDEAAIVEAIQYAQTHTSLPERDVLFVLLSCRLGLRAQEIAKVYFEDITDARGKVRKDSFWVSARNAKYGRARTLPMRADVAAALEAYLAKYVIKSGPIFFNQFGKELESTAVQQQLRRIYKAIGLIGCSSHSGRRTFGTRIARLAEQKGGSLRDAQHLLGHSSIHTTEAYVETMVRHADLVNAL